MKYISLFAIVLTMIFTSPKLLANSQNNNSDEFCGNHLNRFSQQCVGYSYLKREMYFAGSGGAEHTVIVHRMRNHSGAVVGMSLDFVLDTGVSNITNHEHHINNALESFRSAFRNNNFYTYRECDPTIEICCYNGNCFEIYSTPNAQQNEQSDLSHEVTSENPEIQNNRNNRIREIFNDGASLITYIQALRSNSSDATKFRQDLAEDLATESLFTMISTRSDGHKVCINTGTTCEVLSGHVLHSDSFSSADLYHDYGRSVNHSLEEFLYNWFIREMNEGTTCTQSWSCDATDYCQLRLQCQ
ncbi:hypothetical protein [Aliidiomarina sp.]|uniref:hypothetical protein n=1 Tax=Aliidiomarina sp. TaxID=1872439 RepID=UPI003A4D87B5